MARNTITRNDDEMGDVYDIPWWLPKLEKANGRPKDDVPPSPKREFKLAPHHVFCLSGYKLLPNSDPANRRGFPVLCGPGGLPVARLHGDLKENEVSWVLR